MGRKWNMQSGANTMRARSDLAGVRGTAMRAAGASLAAALCFAAASAAADAQPAFTTFDPPGSIATMVMAINDAGSVAGYYEDSYPFLHAFSQNERRNNHHNRPRNGYGNTGEGHQQCWVDRRRLRRRERLSWLHPRPGRKGHDVRSSELDRHRRQRDQPLRHDRGAIQHSKGKASLYTAGVCAFCGRIDRFVRSAKSPLHRCAQLNKDN